MKLSVVLATRNEEANIGECLNSVKGIADEIIVVDEISSDKTVEIAKKFKAKVYSVSHEPIFHKTKQKALDKATGKWILQLDADERVTPQLAKEIQKIVELKNNQIIKEQFERKCREKYELWELFLEHQKLIEKREGHLGKKTGEIVAFFIPRRNYLDRKSVV